MKLISFGLYLVDIGFLPFSESLLHLVIEYHNWSKSLNGIKLLAMWDTIQISRGRHTLL